MKKLHLLFIKSFIGPFIGTFFISLFLFLMQTLWKYLEDLVGKGLGVSVIMEFIFYFAIHLIPLALPLAILLSSIMTFGNLGERYELVAVKSAGISLLRAMRPLFVFSILLAISAFYTSNYLIPKANLSWGALLYDVTNKKPALNITDNVFYKDIDGYAIRVGKKHSDGQTIEDILIYVYERRKKGNNNILVAEKGKMYITEDERFMMLELSNGIRYQEVVEDKAYKERMQHNTMKFKEYEMAIDLSELQFSRTKKELFKEDHRMLNVYELDTKIDSLEEIITKKGSNLSRYLEPYFNIPTDSIQVESDDVDARIDELMARAKTKRKQTHKDTSARRLVNLSMTSPTVTKKALDREQLLEKAIQSVQNMSRISRNNRVDSKDNHELKAKYQAEWHKKYTLAVSCILLFFVGAPLGAIIRKGGFGLPLVISILIFILYYIINVFGEKLVKQGELSAFNGMWLSTIILFPFAIFLTYKASTDSKLFDADSYQRIFKFFKRR
ncbi:MAG: LptF/LptG family permease [Bacteroidia bacterium]